MNYQIILIWIFCEDKFSFDKELTGSTFDKSIKKYDYLIVCFYAPWYFSCNKSHQEFVETAFILRRENSFTIKVDVIIDKTQLVSSDKRTYLYGKVKKDKVPSLNNSKINKMKK